MASSGVRGRARQDDTGDTGPPRIGDRHARGGPAAGAGAVTVRTTRPARAPRRTRWTTAFHLPKRVGRARPVRTGQRMASRKRRLSAPVPPGSPIVPGQRGAMRCPMRSVRRARSRVRGLLLPCGCRPFRACAGGGLAAVPARVNRPECITTNKGFWSCPASSAPSGTAVASSRPCGRQAGRHPLSGHRRARAGPRPRRGCGWSPAGGPGAEGHPHP